jgi:hypothetical protein
VAKNACGVFAKVSYKTTRLGGSCCRNHVVFLKIPDLGDFVNEIPRLELSTTLPDNAGQIHKSQPLVIYMHNLPNLIYTQLLTLTDRSFPLICKPECKISIYLHIFKTFMQRGWDFLPKVYLIFEMQAHHTSQVSALYREVLEDSEILPRKTSQHTAQRRTLPQSLASSPLSADFQPLARTCSRDLIKQSLIVSAKPILEEYFETLRAVFLPQHRYHMECGVLAPIFCRNYSQ